MNAALKQIFEEILTERQRNHARRLYKELREEYFTPTQAKIVVYSAICDWQDGK